MPHPWGRGDAAEQKLLPGSRRCHRAGGDTDVDVDVGVGVGVDVKPAASRESFVHEQTLDGLKQSIGGICY